MASALNIKDPETREMAAELARQQGVSMAAAVKNALARELAEARARRDREFDEWMDRLAAVRGDEPFEVLRDTSVVAIKEF
jgi:hypothetical protein